MLEGGSKLNPNSRKQRNHQTNNSNRLLNDTIKLVTLQEEQSAEHTV